MDAQPTFLALSGETQTGPNIFWTKTALRYAQTTGDLLWLEEYLPTLRNASSFCFDLIDRSLHLLNAPGSLMVDVFIRANFTADSNAMMVGFLLDFAEVEDIVGSKTRAEELRTQASLMKDAMNQRLWDRADNDHYITQLNPDNSTRDFVDYDANLIAIAHAIPSIEQSTAILKRIDSGACSCASGGGPQWVSERYYGPKDTTGGNIGDSRCAMGRIAWFDAHARKRLNTEDSLTAFNRALDVLQNDLVTNTWMHERYGCDGKMQQNRTNFYFEYPSMVVMLMREIRYGINLSYQTVEIKPFGVHEYVYNIGDVYVSYSASAVELNVPGTGTREYQLSGLIPDQKYRVMLEDGTKIGMFTSVNEGDLSFTAPVGQLLLVNVTGSVYMS